MNLKKRITTAIVSLFCLTLPVCAQTNEVVANTGDKSKLIIFSLLGVGAIAIFIAVVLLNKTNKKK